MQSEVIDLRKHNEGENEKKPNLIGDFTTYLTNKETITKLGYDPSSPCKIHFYEWSNLQLEKLFTDEKEFMEFLSNSDLALKSWEESQVKRFSHTNGVYITCKPESHDLLIEPSFTMLEATFKRVTNATPVYRQSPMYGCHPMYTRSMADYEDWD